MCALCFVCVALFGLSGQCVSGMSVWPDNGLRGCVYCVLEAGSVHLSA
jgi:hypothetical protein